MSVSVCCVCECEHRVYLCEGVNGCEYVCMSVCVSFSVYECVSVSVSVCVTV